VSSIRLSIDEDSMDRKLVRALRARKVDLVTPLEAGLIESTDEEQLGAATAQGRVLYSANAADFHRLHWTWLASGREHAGLILCPQQRYSVGEQMRRLLRLMAARSAEEMRNRLEFLANWV